MPVGAVSTPAASAHRRTDAEILADLGRRSDAFVRKLDKDGHGQIDEAELNKFMKHLEHATDKMAQQMGNVPSSGADMKKAIAAARKSMTDNTRMELVVAQAFGDMPSGADPNAKSVPVADVQKAVRAAWAKHLEVLRNPPGGLEGALAAMFAHMMMPDAAYGQVRG